ncbi:efflux RND transporter periplasmic adaptor subunit [Paraburkholderia sp. UCT31]|uniref:efflux RND transporter periplasmic adaptor subunit n=1 Tax=Paraburkholderia sp. UCT31 TaxID=2615209 RepID=UPI001655D1C4|nr:efflux RND transporter periplasmic adaptor subunit [Paraburkholderia sp. UCT31]
MPLTVAALAAVVLLAGCGKSAAPPEKNVGATAVATVHPSKMLFHEMRSVEGDVVSYDSPDIAAQVAGQILAVTALPGARVKKGDLLARIDPTDSTLARANSRGALARASAVLAEKKRNLTRYAVLAKEDLISQQTLTAALSDEQAAEADVVAARASADQAGVTLERTYVRAPFSGVLTNRKAQPGMYAHQGDTLFTLASERPALLQYKAPESLLGVVRPGLPVTVDAGGAPMHGKVESVEPAIDPVSRNFTFTVQAPAGVPAVVPGHSLTAQVELRATRSTAVPDKAVQTVGSASYVFVVRAGKAKRVPVKIGAREGGFVQVMDELSADADVITDGAAFVNDGAPVKTSEVRK